MDGMRLRPARRWGLFAVLSVTALLACACFPLLAQADSSGAVYEPELPTYNGHGGGGGTASHGGSGGGGATTSQIKGSNHSGSSGKSSQGGSHSNAAGMRGANGGGSGQGSPANGSSGPPGAQSQNAAQASAGTQASKGGSSPLVPILIAIAVLAATSIGAVAMRHRRQQRSGTSVSPEAG